MFTGTLYLFNFSTCIMYILIFWYYIKQSASLMSGDTIRKWQMTIKIITTLASVFYLIYGIQYLIVTLQPSSASNKGFCHSFEFIFGSIVQLTLTTMFVAFTHKIQ